MSTQTSHKMPSGFPKQVHQALKSWHSGGDSPLNALYLAQSAIDHQTRVNPQLVSNEILLEGLERLARLDPEASQLLERRFLNSNSRR